MPKKYVVLLAPAERAALLDLTQNGTAAAKQLTRTRILLKADSTPNAGGWRDEAIHDALDVSEADDQYADGRRCGHDRARALPVCHAGSGRRAATPSAAPRTATATGWGWRSALDCLDL